MIPPQLVFTRHISYKSHKIKSENFQIKSNISYLLKSEKFGI